MKNLFMILIITIILPINAQDINAKLGGNTANETYDITDSGDNLLFRVQGDGNVGIGTTTPTAKLHVSGNDGLLIQGGTIDEGNTQNLGAGARLHYYSKRRAFRVGFAASSQWDDINMGYISTAMGHSTIASGYSTFAVGYGATASGDYSTAMGYNTTASGKYSTAMGLQTKAESYGSFAIGRYNIGGGNATQYIGTDPAFEIGIGSNISNRKNALTVLKNGNVGIATNHPNAKLHVNNVLRIGEDLTYPSVYGEISHAGGGNGFIINANAGGGTWADLRLQTNASTKLFIESGGNVGIGTTSPSGKLDVNGSIYQRGSSLYADYVFNDDYELETIQEHSDFMWTNKHLSAIPKAKVDENGNEIVEVGAHRKGIVEELEKAHIYIAQMEERITKLEKLLSIKD